MHQQSIYGVCFIIYCRGFKANIIGLYKLCNRLHNIVQIYKVNIKTVQIQQRRMFERSTIGIKKVEPIKLLLNNVFI
jgi:hypothetical protein